MARRIRFDGPVRGERHGASRRPGSEAARGENGRAHNRPARPPAASATPLTKQPERAIYIPQPPMPHWGSPQPPGDGESQIGSDALDLVCAAGTLNRFSNRCVPQFGQAGFSLSRKSSSNSLPHFSQVYS